MDIDDRIGFSSPFKIIKIYVFYFNIEKKNPNQNVFLTRP